MKRILITVAAVLALSATTGCAKVFDTGIPTPGNGEGREGWYITEPDSLGNSYECWWWSLSDSTAVWCKNEPVSVKP